jgi:hypothetical protein
MELTFIGWFVLILAIFILSIILAFTTIIILCYITRYEGETLRDVLVYQLGWKIFDNGE